MAARRLIAILIALLIISSLAAALAPDREGTTTESSTTTATPESDPTRGDDGQVLRERVPADPEEPRTIEATVGDQLTLLVEVGSPAEVTIPGLGLSGYATPLAPARFELLLREADTHTVMADAKTVARLEVESDDAAGSPAARSGNPGGAGGADSGD